MGAWCNGCLVQWVHRFCTNYPEVLQETQETCAQYTGYTYTSLHVSINLCNMVPMCCLQQVRNHFTCTCFTTRVLPVETCMPITHRHVSQYINSLYISCIMHLYTYIILWNIHVTWYHNISLHIVTTWYIQTLSIYVYARWSTYSPTWSAWWGSCKFHGGVDGLPNIWAWHLAASARSLETAGNRHHDWVMNGWLAG